MINAVVPWGQSPWSSWNSFPKHHKMWDLRFPQQYCWGTKPFWDEILCWHVSPIVLNECWETLTLWEGIRCSTSDNVLHLFESEGGTCERQSHVLYIKIPVLCSIYSVFQPPRLSVATQPFAWRNWKNTAGNCTQGNLPQGWEASLRSLNTKQHWPHNYNVRFYTDRNYSQASISCKIYSQLTLPPKDVTHFKSLLQDIVCLQ